MIPIRHARDTSRPPRSVWTTLALACVLGLAGCGDSYVRRADLALGQGRYVEAIEAYDAALKTSAEPDRLQRSLASAHRAHAMSMLSDGQCNDAREHLARAEALTSVVRADREALCACAEQSQTPPETLVLDYRSLVASGDTRAKTLRRLALLELELGQTAEAMAHMERLSQRAALTVADHLRLTRALLRLGREDQAHPHLLKVIEAGNRDPLLRMRLAELEEARGQIDRSRRIHESLIADCPDNVLVHIRFAAFLARAGDLTAARALRDRADRLRPTHLEKRGNLRQLRKSRR